MKDISKIKLEKKAEAKGHNEHRSGAGTHQDRRTKRERTKSAQKRKAIDSFTLPDSKVQ